MLWSTNEILSYSKYNAENDVINWTGENDVTSLYNKKLFVIGVIRDVYLVKGPKTSCYTRGNGLKELTLSYSGMQIYYFSTKFDIVIILST